MADADQQQVTEWDERGNPVKPAATNAAAWDEKGNPISVTVEHEHTSVLPIGSYQNRKGGPVLNVNETPSSTFGRRFLGSIGGLGEHGESAPTFAETLANIPKSAGRFISSEWEQPTVGGPHGKSVPLGKSGSLAARALFPFHLAAHGIEGIAGSTENAGSDIYEGVKRNDPRAVAGGVGEAAGTIGQIEGAEAGGELAGRTAGKIIPSKAGIGLALRTEKGALKPGVRSVAGLAGGMAGHYTGLPGGELAGFLAGRGLADAIIPARPFDTPTKSGLGAPLPLAGEFYENKAADLMKRGREQEILSRKAAREGKQGIVSPEAGISLGEPRMTGNEGRAATWTNETVTRLAEQGNREAIQQAIRRGMELPPNARYVMGDPDFSRTIYNPRESTTFTPEGQPIRNVENPTVLPPRQRIAIPGESPAPKEIINAATGEVIRPNEPPPIASEEPLLRPKGINPQGVRETSKPSTPENRIQALRDTNFDLKKAIRERRGSEAERMEAQKRIEENNALIEELEGRKVQK